MFTTITGLMGMATGASGGGTPAKGMITPSKSQVADPTSLDLERTLQVLLSNNSTNEALVSEIRRIAEIVVYAEQRGLQSVLDTFFERNVTGTLRTLCLREGVSTDVQIQILQTFSILAQSLRHETNLFHFLSQNHLNAVISHNFEFEAAPEELLAHYVTLLKTVSLRMNRHLCQFFYDSRDPSKFPLYDKAVQFFDNDEPLVRAAARSVILMVHRVSDPEVDEYINRRIEFFGTMCDFIRSRFVKLRDFIGLNDFDIHWLNKVEAGLSDVVDDYSFLQDVLSQKNERTANLEKFAREKKDRRRLDNSQATSPSTPVNKTASDIAPSAEINAFEQVVIDTVLNPLLEDLDNQINIWGLAQCCLVLKSRHILVHIHSKTFGIPQPRSLFNAFSSADECHSLSTVVLAFFLVDRLPDGVDESFVSRKKLLSDSGESVRMSPARKDTDASIKSGPTDAISVEEDDRERGDSTKSESSVDKAVEVGEDVAMDQTQIGKEPRLSSQTPYPRELAHHLLEELVLRTSPQRPCQRPVLVRLLAKLLVHVTFDSRLLDTSDVFLLPEHSVLLKRALSNSAVRLKQIAAKKSFDPALFIESFENEWRDLKSGPLKVSSLVTNPSSVLVSPDYLLHSSSSEKETTSQLEEEQQQQVYKLKNLLQDRIPLHQRNPLHRVEEIRALANIFMVLRLCWASLEQAPDIFLPSVGNADVDSIRENSAIDLRRCEFLEVQVLLNSNGAVGLSSKLLLVLVAGAMLLVEPDNERRATGMCRSVAPIHRIEIGSDVKDGSLLHLCVRSSRRIGLSVRVGSKQEWCLSLKFEGEPKALFARDQIERAAQRARDDKFNRVQAMLNECIVDGAGVETSADS